MAEYYFPYYIQGTRIYFFASLLHMASYCGTGAEALKDGIDSIFAENDLPHLPEDGYIFQGCYM